MSFMPEVKMDFMPEDMSEEETIEVEEFTPEVKDKDKTQEEIEEIQEEEPPLPKAKSKRDDMNINEIFNLPESVPQEPVKLTKKGKPRKKRPPMSEEHKAKLALAREKAMLARKKKAQEKKENKALELEEKELLKKQKVKRVKKLKEEVEEDTPLKPPPEIKKEPTFTKKDLEEAQLQAIMNYEKIRKSRKEEKRIKQEKEREQEALKAQIRRAVAPPQEYNPFANCY
jgi:hypothetical protein